MIYIIYVIYPHDIITYIIEYCIEDSLSLMNFMKTCKIINKKILFNFNNREFIQLQSISFENMLKMQLLIKIYHRLPYKLHLYIQKIVI